MANSSNPSVTINLTKKQIIGLLAGLTVLLFILAMIRFGVFGRIHTWLYQGQLQISVIDSQDSTQLAEAEITVTKSGKKPISEKSKTDAEGKATFKLLSAEYTLEITKDGYQDLTTTTKVNRRKTAYNTFELIKIPPVQVTLTGIVQNYINEEVISGATITLNNLSTKSDSQGKFSISNVTTGEYTIKASIGGYLPYEKKVSIYQDKSDLDPLALVPEGKIVFVSNRESGKRAIFRANFDGSTQEKIIERVGEYEDYNPIVANDGKKFLFSSTREGAKGNNGLISKLYLIDTDGQNLQKISDENLDTYNIAATNDLTYLLYTVSKDDKSIAYSYNTKTKKLNTINAQYSVYNTAINNSGNTIAYTQNYEKDGMYKTHIFIANIDGTNAKEIASYQSANMLKFINNNELQYSVYDNSASKYFKYNVITNIEKEYTPTNTGYTDGVISQDGNKIAYAASRDGKSNIYISNTDGTGEKKLTSVDTVSGARIQWIDNKYIAFSVSKTGESAMYIVGTNGASAKKIVDVAYIGYN